MEGWQEEYIAHTEKIAALSAPVIGEADDFDLWYAQQIRAEQEISSLREQNIRLLETKLFPMLDELYGKDEEAIRSLDAFSDRLMDWRTNLDCGVYVAIHDALLSVYRTRRDRDRIIRELYKLGMGFYYLKRFLLGIEGPAMDAFNFRNELLFTEAGSYFTWFNQIEDEETRGYIIRSLANIALCTNNCSRRVRTSRRVLDIARDEEYRRSSPGLPWDAFVRKTHQQMSANRSELSGSELTSEELALILDSCYEVFKPEEQNENPSIRWLWPYYEMEYNCGYVTLDLTLQRMKELILSAPEESYDMSGLYGCVQLPIYLGRLLKKHERLRTNAENIRFLNEAYGKMRRALLSCPPAYQDDYYHYCVAAVITDYYEVPGVPPYAGITRLLLKKCSPDTYVRARRTGDVMRLICGFIYAQEPSYFDDIPFIREITDTAEKKETLLDYAADCGLYGDLGLLKMNITRTLHTRNLFENEFGIYRLHTVSGSRDLALRPSTQRFADIALGHHSWYDGSDGYPEDYERTASCFRQMTDIAACAFFLTDHPEQTADDLLLQIRQGAGTRFSPMAASYLADEELAGRLKSCLAADPGLYYREIWAGLTDTDTSADTP